MGLVEVSTTGTCEITAISLGPNENVYYAGPMGMEAMFGRILVVEDDFRSGYECEKCGKTGKHGCPDCDDGNSKLNSDIRCKTCHGAMVVQCSECKGQGAVLFIPEVAQRRPTTGQVVSTGDEVRSIKRGDYVCYSNFVGEVWDLSGVDHDGNERTIVVRHMKESEVICRVTNHLSLKRMRNRQNQTSG